MMEDSAKILSGFAAKIKKAMDEMSLQFEDKKTWWKVSPKSIYIAYMDAMVDFDYVTHIEHTRIHMISGHVVEFEFEDKEEIIDFYQNYLMRKH